MEKRIRRDGQEHPEVVNVESYQAETPPSYPDARQWASMAGALGLAAAAGMGTSCSAFRSDTEKPLVATSPASIVYGTHDYRYTIKPGDTLKSLATGFYDDGSAEWNHQWDPKSKFDPAPYLDKIAAANPKLGITHHDAPLPAGRKILLPGVSRVSFGS